MKYLKSRVKSRGANPKQFDECIYSPFKYSSKSKSRRRSSGASNASVTSAEEPPKMLSKSASFQNRRKSDSAVEVDEVTQARREELIDLTTAAGNTAIDAGDSSIGPVAASMTAVAERMERKDPETVIPPENPELDILVHTPEVFLFEYGTVVIWGMTLAHEQRFLKDIAKFETEKLGPDDVQTEDFNFYYTHEYQARIYNDFISLRDKQNYMTKLAISHALAQSVKV